MAEWFEVYEDETGLAASRLRVRRLIVAFAVVSGVVVAGAPVAALLWPSWSAAAATAGTVVLVGHAGWLVWQLARIHRAVWRLGLSVHQVVGYDVTGRRRSVPWPDVERIDIDDAGLVVVGGRAGRAGRRTRFLVPRSFPDYAGLGHRVVSYAEALGRPVWVDGRPWETIGLTELYPLLNQRRQPTR